MDNSTLIGEVVIVSGGIISGMDAKKDFDILVIYNARSTRSLSCWME